MTADSEIRAHQVRCQPYLLELHMLACLDSGPAPTAAEIGMTTGAVIAEVAAASRTVLAAGHGRRHPGVGPFLEVRLNRLMTAADDAIAAARDGDSATLRRVLHRFEALTSAIWTVQDSLREPRATPPVRSEADLPPASSDLTGKPALVTGTLIRSGK